MYMSMDEIKEKYVGNWVFLINCVEGEYHSFEGGEVAIVSKSRDDVLEGWSRYKESEYGPTIFFYAGIPKYGTVGVIHRTAV